MTSEQVPAGPASDVLVRMWSRRGLLGAGVGGALALGLARSASAGTPDRKTRLARNALIPPPELLALVNRTSQGLTQPLWSEALTRGYDGFLDWQLDPASIDDSPLNAMLAAYPSLAMTARQIYDTYVVPGQQGVPPAQLRSATVLRSVYSKRQLFERMVEFWTDHFNIDQGDGESQTLKTVDDRDVIRANALGKFPDMLKASAHSGAMLYYLDNYTNKNTGVNENYAREIMELHTLSPGNYTETDVRQLAYVLTGWTIWRQGDPTYGTFRYRSDWHDNGVHNVLGHAFGPNGGQAEGESMLDVLTQHPACAQFIARKLCRWLLSYDPPKNVVDEVAATYASTGGDIKSMIRVALRPDNVLHAGVTTDPKLKRPFTFLASLLRATSATTSQPNGINSLLGELTKLGQVPFSWGPPDGFPDSEAYWGSAVLPRWSFASRLLDGSINGVVVDTTTLFSGVSQAQCAERCNQILASGHMAPEDVAEVNAFARSFGSLTTQVKRESLALAASSPSFQYY